MWKRCLQRLGIGWYFPSTMIALLSPGEMVRIRGRLHHSVIKGKIGFLRIRQPPVWTVQAVLTHPSTIAAAKNIPPESVVDVWGSVRAAEKRVDAVTRYDVEIQAEKLQCVSQADSPLPFPINDAEAKLDTRLDHRSFDLRTPLNAAIPRIVSHTTQAFRRFLLQKDFVEIFTPKLLSSASEGGSAVFPVQYYDSQAFLAQSPQLYKQMAVMGDLGGVFEVGPVFRAEQSNTHRHLSEFIGLDVEMIVEHGYMEVIDLAEHLLSHMISSVLSDAAMWVGLAQTENASAAEAAKTPLQIFLDREAIFSLELGVDSQGVQPSDVYGGRCGFVETPILRISFCNAVKLLREKNVIEEDIDDFTPPLERELGKLVRERYGVDFFVCDQYPRPSRPFYTAVMEDDDKITKSFDVFLRGEEICSGSQRINDPKVLKERAVECGVRTELIADYLDAFRFGAWPHGGFGIGLERFVMLLLGLQNVRLVSMFPRDPKRLRP